MKAIEVKVACPLGMTAEQAAFEITESYILESQPVYKAFYENQEVL